MKYDALTISGIVVILASAALAIYLLMGLIGWLP